MKQTLEDFSQLDWTKMNNLLPAIAQDYRTAEVLMLGYMNPAALAQTLANGMVTFYSRSQQKLWVKGETSGNYLKLIKIVSDCDHDSLLLLVEPMGPTCHQGTTSCFAANDIRHGGYLAVLENIIDKRLQELPTNSYTVSLVNSGINRIAQKVGEEAVEVAIAAVSDNNTDIINETADLLYHLLVLLHAKDIQLDNILAEIHRRTLVAK
jgi:phosphoribosyl-AMP cyclohydrolase / phosphoribosyl-ATP pyrophosphohydrolase